MAKKVNKTTLQFGGSTLNISKSKTQAAVRYTPEARPAKATKRGVAAPPSLDGFEMVSSKRGIDAKLDKMRAQSDVAVGSHVWEVDNDGNIPLIPTGNLYLEFVPGSNVLTQRALLDELGLTIKENVSDNAVRVTVSAQSPNPVKCAVLLQKNKKLVLVAEPEFVTQPMERDFMLPSGKFVATQWHLENTGGQIPIVDIPNAVFGTAHFKPGADAKVKAAWQTLQSLGRKDLKIAVIDTGFAAEHPQLRGDGTKIKGTFNAASKTGDVSPLVRYSDGSVGAASHGTSCAAVAAGAWDAQGILGACPNARLLLIKLDVLSDDAIRNAFEFAQLNGADVISCSLGFPQPIPLSTFITNYLRQVIAGGRGGRGLPVLFAAGNANPASNNVPRQISDFAAHPDVICVTASNSLDQRSSYSFFGPNAFLCAPTNGDEGVGITTATCDVGPDKRSVELGYTSGFGGTSSATPLAAGVVALMLTANPDLRVADVRNILARSVDKIGPSGTYNANGHSQYYGFGRINAQRAVQMAAALASGNSGTPTPATNTGGAQAPAPSAGLKGRVTSPNLNVRTGPSTSNAKVAEYKQGDVIDLVEKVGGWWRIGQNRFVNADYVQVISAPLTATGTASGARAGRVASPTLNVRSGPGTNFGKVAELKQGNSVSVYEQSSDGWYRIGTGQWVLGKYVTLV